LKQQVRNTTGSFDLFLALINPCLLQGTATLCQLEWWLQGQTASWWQLASMTRLKGHGGESRTSLICLLGAERAALYFAQAFAVDMLLASRTVVMPHNGQPTTVRIGLHTGPVTSGLIGSRLPKFSLFGDSMVGAQQLKLPV
jgi:hypothetical protein